MKIKLFIFSIFTALTLLAFSHVAEAATLFIAPPSSEIGVGEKMTVDLKIDSEGISFNAAQAVIRFPKDTLEVVSLDKTTTSSSFSFWLEEPNFSNTDGIISFIGGTPYGISGSSIQVLRITFITKGSGSGIITLSDAAITAADGSGTNILSKIVDAIFAIVVKKETPPVPTPTPIVRTAVSTGKLPVKPELTVPLYPHTKDFGAGVYPDDTRWSNLTSQFNVSWDLPPDVIGISTTLNGQPSFLPERSEGLFDNKMFAVLSDGAWYLHVRFRNDIGWGPTAHYRLAIDTEPPLGFEITVVEGEATDNPTPTLQFKTNDALSGLKEYLIRIGDGDLIKISAAEFNGTFTLPLQAPGKSRIVVKAVDQADNGVEDSVTLETIPLASPAITFVTSELFSDEEKGLTVKGSSLPKTNVLLRVYRKEALVAEGSAHGDERGNWEFTFDQAFKNGRYKVTAQGQDARGARSLIMESPEVRVKSKPIIQIGAFQLGKGGAALLLLLFLIVGFGGGIWFYKKRQEKLALRVVFAESEVAKIFKLIMEDVDGLSKSLQTSSTADDEYALKRIKDDIKKMESYIQKGLEKIKK